MLNIEPKEDSAEKLAAIAGKPTKNFLFAEEVNNMVEAINVVIEQVPNKADLVGGKVPASQLPAYVDDVLEFADFDAFPTTGETGKIYVALDTNFTYRWSGSAYVQIGGGETYIENTSVSGGYPIDFNVDTHRLTLIGNTTFSEINLPALGFSKTITLHITGNFGVIFPASWTQYISGEYKGTATLNTIVIETIGTERKVQISQPG